MRVLRELLFFKEIHCPVCRAAELLIIRDRDVLQRFLVNILEKNANHECKEMQYFWRYSDEIGAEVYPTFMLGRAEDDFYPFVFHIWKEKGQEHVGLDERQRRNMLNLKEQLIKIDKQLDSNPALAVKSYHDWKKTYGLLEV